MSASKVYLSATDTNPVDVSLNKYSAYLLYPVSGELKIEFQRTPCIHHPDFFTADLSDLILFVLASGRHPGENLFEATCSDPTKPPAVFNINEIANVVSTTLQFFPKKYGKIKVRVSFVKSDRRDI